MVRPATARRRKASLTPRKSRPVPVVRGGLWGWLLGWLLFFNSPILLGMEEFFQDGFLIVFWAAVLGILYLFFSFLLWRHGRGRGREVRWPFRIGIVLGIAVMICNIISIFG